MTSRGALGWLSGLCGLGKLLSTHSLLVSVKKINKVLQGSRGS